jgi:hypothetical protein
VVNESLAIFSGAALGAILLLAEHLALWRYRERLSKPQAYVIGTATCGAAITLVAGLLDDWRIAIVFWTVVGAGGATVAGAYLVRAVGAGQERSRSIADHIVRRAEERLRGLPEQPDDRRN